VSLSPIKVIVAAQSADGYSRKELHVFELYGRPIGLPPEQPVLTVVAVQNFYRNEAQDWAAYWLPFSSDDSEAQYTEQRVDFVRKIGVKVPKDVACVMFPRLDSSSYRE